MVECINVTDRLSELMVKAIWYNEHGDTIVGTYTKLGWAFSYYPGVLTTGIRCLNCRKENNNG